VREKWGLLKILKLRLSPTKSDIGKHLAVPPEGEEIHSFQTDNVSKISLKIAGCLMFVKIFLLIGGDDPK
jgi:hypothetical protein